MKILIFRRGLLGDSLMTIPALKIIREKNKNINITYLSEKHINKNFVNPEKVLSNFKLVDNFLQFNVGSNKLFKIFEIIKFLISQRKQRYDLAYFINTSDYSRIYLFFNYLFLKFLNSKNVIIPKNNNLTFLLKKNFFKIHESQIIINTISNKIPSLDEIYNLYKLKVDKNEDIKNTDYIKKFKKYKYVGVGHSSNWKSKIWNSKNYFKLLKIIKERYNLEPAFFGIEDEFNDAEKIKNRLGFGLNLCGKLSISDSISILSNCRLYVGNDSGLSHMAALSHVPSIVIQASVDIKGRWDVLNPKAFTLRPKIDCSGWAESDCPMPTRCIDTIKVEDVINKINLLI